MKIDFSVHSPQKKKIGTSFISNSCAKPSLFSEVCTSSICLFSNLFNRVWQTREESYSATWYQLLLISIYLLNHSGTISSWEWENVIMDNHSDHPGVSEWGGEGKSGLYHTHGGHSEVFPHLHILGDVVWSSSYRAAGFTAFIPDNFWLAEWPWASHMRFLQHIKNDPTL